MSWPAYFHRPIHWTVAAAAIGSSIFFMAVMTSASAAQASHPKSQEGDKSGYSMRMEVPLVTLDVSVLTPDGYFVHDLSKENFRVLEDGAPQTITGFSQIQAPVTAVLLAEYSVETFGVQQDALRSCFYFTHSLKPDDWTALVLFDRHPHLVQDFTQNKNELQASLNGIGIPLLRESNLFDALYDTVDRLQAVEGRKYIILLADGEDSFSRKILDEVYKQIETARDTVIYSIDTGRGVGHLQGDNQMKEFARMTGGQFYFANSTQEFGDVFRVIGQSIRNRYILAYHPTHTARDGAWHKIKVEVLSKDGRKASYQIVVREGYRAKAEGN